MYIPGIDKQKDKTFFFANYEGLRLNGGLTFGGNIPMITELGGNFASELTTNLAKDSVGFTTDALCRPVYQGVIYNPYTSRSVMSTCPTANNTVGQTV